MNRSTVSWFLLWILAVSIPAQLTRAGWQTDVVDSTGDVGKYNSIALDPDGYPRIAYHDSSTNFDLKYALWNGDSWSIQTLEVAGKTGYEPSLAIDKNGFSRIVYFESDTYNLRFLFEDSTGWHSQTLKSSYSSTDPDQVIDALGYSHIVYVADSSLFYSYADESGWHEIQLSSNIAPSFNNAGSLTLCVCQLR
jgi:hypothetical protein